MRDQAANQRQPHAARYFTLGFSPAAVETRKNRRALLRCIELHYIYKYIAALLYVDGVVEDF
jgi:hypothetical protein